MAVDIFGGFATHVGYGTADRPNEPGGDRFHGWDVGASFRPFRGLVSQGRSAAPGTATPPSCII
jgi:hypothetical protein